MQGDFLDKLAQETNQQSIQFLEGRGPGEILKYEAMHVMDTASEQLE